MNKLIKLANLLDKRGYRMLANHIDIFIHAQANPQISITFTTAQEPMTIAQRWIQKRKMEQQTTTGPDKGTPTGNIQETITASATPTVEEWRRLLVYTFSVVKPKDGITNGTIGIFVKTSLKPDQLTYLKQFISKQVEELDATKGALKSSL